MFAKRRFLVGIALAGIAAFGCASFLHAVLPHEHHEGAPIWEMIHSTLGSEDKKVALPLVSSLFAMPLTLLALCVYEFLSTKARHNPFQQLLSRGKLSYRAFG